MMLDKKRRPGNRLPGQNSKVQLPNELLISKLINGLAMPNILEQKELPLPTKDFEEEGNHQPLIKAIYDELVEKEPQAESEDGGVFNQLYKSQLPTSVTDPEPASKDGVLGSAEPKISEQPHHQQISAPTETVP